MDLTIRLQRYFRTRREPARITFDPNPLAWTQAPEDWRSLRSQRYRWRRGLLQTLWRYRGMIGNPRFGTVGLGSLPYVAFFEGLGPLVEAGGYAIAIAAAALGYLNWQYCGMMIAVAVLSGAAVTLLSVLLSDATSRQYVQGSDLALLIAVAILESFGYRQLNAIWGCVGTIQALTGKTGWGTMKRQAFRA
jgi:cellulose synthase/poly-beta-1,6-N-acetylglucosamine synthase-like glycosyltransferase